MSAALPLRARLAMLLRSFAVQGSFNYRTLIGSGFAWVLLPALRHTYRGRADELDEAVRRHQAPFNSHPYLVGIAAGAVSRLEQEGAPPPVIDRFKGALRGSLGAIGDTLFWAGIRPAGLLLALLLIACGAPIWAALLGFLVPYNAAHVATRIWGFRLGLEHGAGVAAGLRSAPFATLGLSARRVGAFLLGALLPLLGGGALTGATSPIIIPLVAAAAIVGIVRGERVRDPALAGLGVLILFGLLLGAV